MGIGLRIQTFLWWWWKKYAKEVVSKLIQKLKTKNEVVTKWVLTCYDLIFSSSFNEWSLYDLILNLLFSLLHLICLPGDSSSKWVWAWEHSSVLWHTFGIGLEPQELKLLGIYKSPLDSPKKICLINLVRFTFSIYKLSSILVVVFYHILHLKWNPFPPTLIFLLAFW